MGCSLALATQWVYKLLWARPWVSLKKWNSPLPPTSFLKMWHLWICTCLKMSVFYPHICLIVWLSVEFLGWKWLFSKILMAVFFLFPELLLESFLLPVFSIPPLQFLCFLFLEFLDWSYDFLIFCVFCSAFWEILSVSLPNLLLNISVLLAHI